MTRAAAKHIAVAMAYDDVIRVADLKTRASRFERVRERGRAQSPISSSTPPNSCIRAWKRSWARFPQASACGSKASLALCKALDRVVNRGRRVQTGTVSWFLPLYVLGGLKRFRRGTLRHKREVAHRDAWLDLARNTAANRITNLPSPSSKRAGW